MSTLQSILNNIQNSSGAGNSTNLLVQVDIWEDNQVKGVRLDTGEQLTITLNNSFQKKADAKFDRPDLNKIKQAKFAKAGAVLFFENCYFIEDRGLWEARWASLIVKSSTDKKTTAKILKAKVSVGKTGSGKEYIEVRALYGAANQPIKSQPINNIEDLMEMATSHLKPMDRGLTPYILLLASDGTNDFAFEIKASMVDVTSESGEINRVVDPVATNSINKYLETTWGKTLIECIEHSDISIKAAKGLVVYCGTSTKDAILNGSRGHFIKNEFMLDKEGQYNTNNLGYKDVVVGVRFDDERQTKFAVFVNGLKPFDAAQPPREFLA